VEILSSKMGLFIIALNVTIEVPNVDAVSFTDRYDLSIVSWIEYDGA
jgi:hypothetical protein